MSAIEADCLVVGGGIMGCALAYWLTGAGRGVVLIERDELNGGASGGNAGSLHVQMLSHFARLEAPRDAADAERPLRLHVAAVAEWQALRSALGEDLELHLEGGLMVAETAGEQRVLESKVVREARHGVVVDLLEGAAARAFAPYLGSTVRCVARCATEGRLNPCLATPAIARAAIARGARLLRATALHSLERDGTGFLARTGAGAIRAGSVINAAGPWAGEVAAMLGVALPVTRRPLQMSVSEATAPFLAHLVQHAGRRLTLKQATSGNVLIGGGWPGRLDQAGHAQLARQSIEGNLATACRVVPQMAHLNLLRVWTAFITRVPDGNPVLGETPGMPGFFQALAIPNGYTLGPLCARLVAEAVCGRSTSFDLSPWSPGRFAAAASHFH
jgi:glycine/D-amino acid oxidase-like deaminating enzyme